MTNYFRVDIDSKTTHPVHYDVAFQERGTVIQLAEACMTCRIAVLTNLMWTMDSDDSSVINFDREERLLIMQDVIKFLDLKFWAYDGSCILYIPNTASLGKMTIDYPIIGKNGEPSQSRVPKYRKPFQVCSCFFADTTLVNLRNLNRIVLT